MFSTTLPEGLTLKIFDVFDNKTFSYEMTEYASKKELEEKRSKASNGSFHAGFNTQTPEKSFEGINAGAKGHADWKSTEKSHDESGNKEKTTEAVVTTTCKVNVKKISFKPRVEDYLIQTAKSAKSEKEALRTIVNYIRSKDNTSIPFCYYVNCGGTFTIDVFASSSQKVDFSVLTNAASKETEAYASANIKGWGQSFGGKMEYKNSNDSNEMNKTEKTESNINVTFKHQSMPKCSNVLELEEKLSKGASEWFLSLDI